MTKFNREKFPVNKEKSFIGSATGRNSIKEI